MTPALEREVDRLLALFRAAGATRVAPEALQPADRLLDLYGEDIRARAFTVRDGDAEFMLRPDFTLPVLEAHLASGAPRGTYSYAGPVWRRRAAGTLRAREFWQVGIERLGDRDAPRAEAEVFVQIRDALPAQGLRGAIGDMGLLTAAVDALDLSPQRRAALRRHIWRPRRFRRLLARFAAPVTPPAIATDALREAVHAAGPQIGVRTRADVIDRLRDLHAEAAEPPLSAAAVALVSDVLRLSGPARTVRARLADLARGVAALAPAAERLAARLEALEAQGVDTASLPFDGAFSGTTLEYYDGFVFGFRAADRLDLPVIASGGRYDALTRALGGDTPAIGAVIRPQALPAAVAP
ncbi:MAG: ATP phosphoribosyltransferase regulatory subunit [Pseudomonadota bacterium]